MSWGPLDLLKPLWDLLVCLAKWAVGALVAGVTELLNLVIAALGLLLGPALSLLPNVTLDPFVVPSFVAHLNYFFPVGTFVALTAVVVTVLLVWPLAGIALRWLKVIP